MALGFFRVMTIRTPLEFQSPHLTPATGPSKAFLWPLEARHSFAHLASHSFLSMSLSRGSFVIKQARLSGVGQGCVLGCSLRHLLPESCTERAASPCAWQSCQAAVERMSCRLLSRLPHPSALCSEARIGRPSAGWRLQFCCAPLPAYSQGGSWFRLPLRQNSWEVGKNLLPALKVETTTSLNPATGRGICLRKANGARLSGGLVCLWLSGFPEHRKLPRSHLGWHCLLRLAVVLQQPLRLFVLARHHLPENL